MEKYIKRKRNRQRKREIFSLRKRQQPLKAYTVEEAAMGGGLIYYRVFLLVVYGLAKMRNIEQILKNDKHFFPHGSVM